MSSSDSDYSNYNSSRRSKQRQKIVMKKKKQVVIKSKKDEYSSDSESRSDSDSSRNSRSDGDRDDDQDDAEQPRMKQVKETEPPKPGFSLPGKDEEPKIFVLVGSCSSGKSYMLKYMMQRFAERNHFSFGLTMTSTKFTGDYSYLPDRSVRDFDMDYLEKYIQNLRDKIEAGKKEHGPKWNLAHNFVILDDSLGLTANSSFFTNFIACHRHTKTTIFLLSQLLTAARSVSTVVRANTSYAFLWPSSMKNALEGLWKNYGQMFTQKEFKEELDKCRERKYSCLVFTNNPNFTTASEAYCRICAPNDVPDFEIQF